MSETYRDHCPRCCPPGSYADVLPARARGLPGRCSEEQPCVWMKRPDRFPDPAHTLEDRDMMVIEIDGLQVAFAEFEACLRDRGVGPGKPMEWKHWIRRPTDPKFVMVQAIEVLREVRERLLLLGSEVRRERSFDVGRGELAAWPTL